VGSNLEDVSLHNDYDAKRVIDSTFIVQEYIDGGTLRDQLLSQVEWLLFSSLIISLIRTVF
jgi:hypothetical protein